MNDTDITRIFMEDIEPGLSNEKTSNNPVTVFLGGQPGAGKTKGQMLTLRLHPEERLLPIIGDDYRQYHPDYRRLVKDDPLAMPDVTAYASGRWTGMVVAWADAHQVSCIIEGTWRNRNTVLNEARHAHLIGRATHAVLVAVPPAISRLGILERYYLDRERGLEARWTPPQAHEDTVEALTHNVPFIATSGVMDRLTVIDRAGNTLYDGTDPNQFVESWHHVFTRPPSRQERADMAERVSKLKQLAQKHTPSNSQVLQLFDTLTVQDSSTTSTGGVWVQPHMRNGRPVRGYWRSH
ncbi:Zeta toxin family protein [Bifidobacterium animalis subsp. animalis]|nr:Zeta toxin family protein [Bifidobacterium animalis subsp. animalis]